VKELSAVLLRRLAMLFLLVYTTLQTPQIKKNITYSNEHSLLPICFTVSLSLYFSSSMFQHITPLLAEGSRADCIQICSPCLHGSAPAYLTDELCQVADVEARQRLRSSSSSSLIVSRTRLTIPSVTELFRSPLLASGTVCLILSLPHLP